MIPDDKLKAWRALADAATPGPWAATGLLRDDDDAIVVIDRDPGSDEGSGNVTVAETAESNYPNEDAAFIAVAREAVPALLDEVRDLGAENHRLQVEFDRQRSRLTEQGHADLALSAALDERDRLAAENERLRAQVARMRPVFGAAQRVIDDAQPSLDALVDAVEQADGEEDDRG